MKDLPPCLFLHNANMTTESSPQGAPLSDEFSASTPIQRFHRFAITEHGDQVFFGLLDKGGINHYFVCDRETISKIALEFSGLATHSQMLANGGAMPGYFALPFDTTMAFTLIPNGGDSEGNIQFMFFTPSNQCFQTLIGPNLASQLSSSLDQALSSMPQVPKGGFPSAKVPGEETKASRVVHYFGQSYPAEILEALGMLMVRVNLIERDMAELFSALTNLPIQVATAILHSTRNTEARIDMIRSAIPLATTASKQEVDVGRKKIIGDDLTKLKNLYVRRNHLVHGHWSFKGDKFLVELLQPNTKDKVKATHVTKKSIEELATDYRNMSIGLNATSQTIRLCSTEP